MTAVPRSGCTSTSPTTTPVIIAGGKKPIEKTFTRSALRDSSSDRYSTSANFASSDGWNDSAAEAEPAHGPVDPGARRQQTDQQATDTNSSG